MSQDGPNPHEVPGSFGSQSGGSWQSGPTQGQPQGQPPQQYPGQPDPNQSYPGQPDPNQPYPNPQQYPNQPYPTQQYPAADAYGQPPAGWGQPQQGQPQQGQPQQPWGYPPAPNQNQPRSSNKVLFGVIGGVVGLALIGGVGYAVQSANSTSPTTLPSVSVPASGPGSVPGPTVPTAKASDVVASYLRALGAGDATTVLSLAATQPTETTFLTNAVLAKATAGKISNVNVPEVTDPNATSVDATYSLAGKPITTTFAVTNVGGQFRLAKVAADVDLTSLARVPVTVAGTRPDADSDQVQLFPGVYPVAAANKMYALGSSQVTVPDLEPSTPAGRTVTLSPAGRAAIIKATTAKYKSCLKQNSVAPKGCSIGVRMPTGVKLRTSTISWTTRGGAKWSRMKPKLLSTSVAEAAAPAKVHFYARDARVSGRYWFKDVNITGVRALISGNRVIVSFY